MATKKKQDPAESTEKQSTTEAKAAPVPRVKDEQNGVSRPSSGSTLRVWEIADQISAEQKRPATRTEVTEVGSKEGLVLGTIHTQFGRWRKYNGLVTPSEERAAANAEAKAEKEAAKKAEKEAKAKAKAKKVDKTDDEPEENGDDLPNADE